MTLTTKIKQQLKAKAHSLKPIILMGHQGLTDAVNKEINRALDDHELIKIRVSGADRDERRAMMKEICTAQRAEFIAQIGNIVVVYRKGDA